MKKYLSSCLLLVLVLILTVTTGCNAGDITVKLNGDNLPLDPRPVIVDGRTLVPFRGIFEALGAEVGWNETERTVTGTLKNREIVLKIDSTVALVDGKEQTLDVPPCIRNGYTFVPVRFVSESLGAEVEWDSIRKMVLISYNTELKIIYADVGQGDCQLIISDGKTMLIDGGTADKSNTVVAVLKKHGVSYIDYIVCTHAHADHCGGLAGALRNFEVGAVIAPVTEEDTKAYLNFKDGVKRQNLDIINPHPGDTFLLGSGSFTILGPVDEKYSDLNNTSVVLKLTYGDRAFIFTGDCEAQEEKDILATGADLSADVLKVGHHGSENSTTYSFLREIMPEYAIISVGADNTYGHPTNEALSRLRDVGTKVYRTDLQGDIILTSDGETINITTYKNQNAVTNPTTQSQQEELYIGNLRSKKLHKATCSGLPEEVNRTYFSSRADAISGGYEPCKKCNP